MWEQGNPYPSGQAYIQDGIDFLNQVDVVGETSGINQGVPDANIMQRITTPNGYAGDICIIYLTTDANITNWSPPDGWNAVMESDTTNFYNRILYKFMDSPLEEELFFNKGEGGAQAWHCIRLSGVDDSNPFLYKNSNETQGGDTSWAGSSYVPTRTSLYSTSLIPGVALKGSYTLRSYMADVRSTSEGAPQDPVFESGLDRVSYFRRDSVSVGETVAARRGSNYAIVHNKNTENGDGILPLEPFEETGEMEAPGNPGNVFSANITLRPKNWHLALGEENTGPVIVGMEAYSRTSTSITAPLYIPRHGVTSGNYILTIINHIRATGAYSQPTSAYDKDNDDFWHAKELFFTETSGFENNFNAMATRVLGWEAKSLPDAESSGSQGTAYLGTSSSSDVLVLEISGVNKDDPIDAFAVSYAEDASGLLLNNAQPNYASGLSFWIGGCSENDWYNYDTKFQRYNFSMGNYNPNIRMLRYGNSGDNLFGIQIGIQSLETANNNEQAYIASYENTDLYGLNFILKSENAPSVDTTPTGADSLYGDTSFAYYQEEENSEPIFRSNVPSRFHLMRSIVGEVSDFPDYDTTAALERRFDGEHGFWYYIKPGSDNSSENVIYTSGYSEDIYWSDMSHYHPGVYTLSETDTGRSNEGWFAFPWQTQDDSMYFFEWLSAGYSFAYNGDGEFVLGYTRRNNGVYTNTTISASGEMPPDMEFVHAVIIQDDTPGDEAIWTIVSYKEFGDLLYNRYSIASSTGTTDIALGAQRIGKGWGEVRVGPQHSYHKALSIEEASGCFEAHRFRVDGSTTKEPPFAYPAASTSGSASAATTISIDKPENLQNNDMLVAQVTLDVAENQANWSASGWINALVNTDTTNIGITASVWYRIISDIDTEPDTYDINWTTSAGAVGTITPIRGVDINDPIKQVRLWPQNNADAQSSGLDVDSTASSTSVSAGTRFGLGSIPASGDNTLILNGGIMEPLMTYQSLVPQGYKSHVHAPGPIGTTFVASKQIDWGVSPVAQLFDATTSGDYVGWSMILGQASGFTEIKTPHDAVRIRDYRTYFDNEPGTAELQNIEPPFNQEGDLLLLAVTVDGVNGGVSLDTGDFSEVGGYDFPSGIATVKYFTFRVPVGSGSYADTIMATSDGGAGAMRAAMFSIVNSDDVDKISHDHTVVPSTSFQGPALEPSTISGMVLSCMYGENNNANHIYPYAWPQYCDNSVSGVVAETPRSTQADNWSMFFGHKLAESHSNMDGVVWGGSGIAQATNMMAGSLFFPCSGAARVPDSTPSEPAIVDITSGIYYSNNEDAEMDPIPFPTGSVGDVILLLWGVGSSSSNSLSFKKEANLWNEISLGAYHGAYWRVADSQSGAPIELDATSIPSYRQAIVYAVRVSGVDTVQPFFNMNAGYHYNTSDNQQREYIIQSSGEMYIAPSTWALPNSLTVHFVHNNGDGWPTGTLSYESGVDAVDAFSFVDSPISTAYDLRGLIANKLHDNGPGFWGWDYLTNSKLTGVDSYHALAFTLNPARINNPMSESQTPVILENLFQNNVSYTTLQTLQTENGLYPSGSYLLAWIFMPGQPTFQHCIDASGRLWQKLGEVKCPTSHTYDTSLVLYGHEAYGYENDESFYVSSYSSPGGYWVGQLQCVSGVDLTRPIDGSGFHIQDAAGRGPSEQGDMYNHSPSGYAFWSQSSRATVYSSYGMDLDGSPRNGDRTVDILARMRPATTNGCSSILAGQTLQGAGGVSGQSLVSWQVNPSYLESVGIAVTLKSNKTGPAPSFFVGEGASPSASTTLTVNYPSSGIQPGDLLALIAASNEQSFSAVSGAGWTNRINDTVGSRPGFTIYTKTADGTENGQAEQLTLGSDTSVGCILNLGRYAGGQHAAPNVTTIGASATISTAAAGATTRNNVLVLHMAAIAAGGENVVAPQESDAREIINIESDGSTSGVSLVISYNMEEVPGTPSGQQFSWDNSRNNLACMWTIEPISGL